MDFTLKLRHFLLAILAATGVASVQAAVPDGINYQAYLTNADGSPVDADVSITFAAYNVDVGGVPLWSSTQLVTAENGLFSVTLGDPINPFPPGLFDTPIYIGLFVAGEEMLPRRALQTTAYSFKSDDANTLEGMTSAELDQSSEVTALQDSVSILSDETALLSGDVSANSSAIGTLQSDVSANTSGVATNDGRITTLEASGGDISSVTAGPGLTGGATSGAAVLSIPNSGVTNGMLAANSVDSSKVTNGSLTAGDLNPNDTYQLNTLNTNSLTAQTVDIQGQFDVNSAFDIRIYDNFNGFRWFDPNDGNAQMASIEVRQPDVTFRDQTRNRVIFQSEDNGIGIGTPTPINTHDVTISSLAVVGSTDIGLERIVSQYTLSSMSASCHSHGNLPCYYGLTTVNCPVGKRVVGGGSSGSSGLFGSLSISGPQSDTSFTCAASYDLADSNRNCFAICARID